MAYEILLRAITNDYAQRDYYWTSPEGRAFEVAELGDHQFFLTECIPTGSYFEGGRLVSDSALAEELRRRLRELTPSEFLRTLPSTLKVNRLSRASAGMRLGAYTYGSLDDVKAVIKQVLQEDRWYQSYSESLAAERIQQHRESGQAAREKLAYWSAKLDALSWVPRDHSEQFRGFSNLYGVLSKETRDLFLSFMNEPCERTWDALSRQIILGGSMTAWQIWIQCDPSAPRSKDAEGWECWPDPDLFRTYVKSALEQEIAKARNKIAEAEKELQATRNG